MDKQIIGVVGLGLIGGSMCKALIKSGHIVVGMDADKTTAITYSSHFTRRRRSITCAPTRPR